MIREQGFTRRPVAVIGIVIAVVLLGCAATLLAWSSERQAAQQRDQRAADVAAASLAEVFTSTVSSLRGTDALAVDGVVTTEEFTAYAADILPTTLFRAVAYTKVVPEADRAAFEAERGFQIRDTDGKGGYLPAEPRDPHLVVVDVYPENDVTTSLLGFDIRSDPARAAAAEASAASDEPAIGDPISLADSANPGVFVVERIADPHGEVIGYLTSGLSIDDLVLAATPDTAAAGRVSLALGDEVLSGSTTAGRTASFEIAGREFTVRADDADDAHTGLAWLTALGTALLATGVALSFRRDRRLTTSLSRSLSTSVSVAEVARHLAAATTLAEAAAVIQQHAPAATGAREVRVLMSVDRHDLVLLADMVPLQREEGRGVERELQRVSRAAMETGGEATVSLEARRESGDGVHAATVVALPMPQSTGTPAGAIAFVTDTPPNRTAQRTMTTVRDICAQAIARVSVTEAQALAAARNRAVVGLGERLAAAADANAVVRVIADDAGPILRAARTSVARRSLQAPRMLLVRHGGGASTSDELVESSAELPMSECVRSRSPIVLTGRAQIQERFPILGDDLDSNSLRSLICTPLLYSSGECAGSLQFAWDDRDGFTDDDRSAVAMIADLSSRALERADITEVVQGGAARLNELTKALASASSAAQVIDIVRQYVPPVVGAHQAFVALEVAGSSALELDRSLDEMFDGIEGSSRLFPLDEPAPSVDAFVGNHPIFIESLAVYLERYPHLSELLTSARLTAGAHLPVHDASGTAIGVLTVVWTTPTVLSGTIRAVLATMADVVGETLSRAASYDQEHAVILELQSALLAPIPPVRGLELAMRYEPAGSAVGIGGDWYDALITASDRFLAVIGDITGHGAEAVAAMAQVQAVIKHMLRIDTPLDEVMEHASHMLEDVGTFASAMFVEVDIEGGVLRYANAGHPFGLVRRADGSVDQLTGGRRALLGVASPMPVVAEAPFGKGDELLIYTDGLVERRSGTIIEHMERLMEVLRADAGSGSVEDRLDRLVAGAQAAQAGDGARVDDDLAAILIRRT